MAGLWCGSVVHHQPRKDRPALSTRFRTLVLRHLGAALHALTIPGRLAGAVVTGIVAAVTRRRERLELLMDRFEAGVLRTRPGFTRRASGRLSGAVAPEGAPVRAWPEHRAGWLDLVGRNTSDVVVRRRWTMWQGGQTPTGWALREFDERLRALVAEDAVLRGLLAVSREARRHVRWLLRTSSVAALPAELREPPRARRVRKPGPRRPASPRRVRAPGPFETEPENLFRDERELRGLWVPPPQVEYNYATLPIVPTAVQLSWRRERGG